MFRTCGEGVVSNHGGDLLVLWSELIVIASTIRRALGRIIGVETDELLNEASWRLLPVYLLEVVDDVLVGGHIELVDQREQSAFIDHVANHQWDLGHFAFRRELGRIVDEILSIGSGIPWDQSSSVRQEVCFSLDGCVDAIVGSRFRTSKLVGGAATANALHESIEDGLSMMVVEHLRDLRTEISICRVIYDDKKISPVR